MGNALTIPIVFVTDENYVMRTSVALTSIIVNKQPGVIYDAFILTDCISAKSKNKLESLSLPDFRVKIINMDRDKISNVGGSNVPSAIHVSSASLFKFIIPELFDGYEKILYLDGDVIIKHDLSALFGIDISRVYAAVVKDMKPMISYQPSQTDKLGVDHTAYFNTGMMLLNLDLLRKDGISDKLIEYRTNELNYFMDQDAFNCVFRENVLYVDYSFNFTYSNFQYYSFNQLKAYYGFEEASEKELLDSTVVLHLSSKEKPWLFHDMSFSVEWDAYYIKSPFKNNKLKRASIKDKKPETEKNAPAEYKKYKSELDLIKNSFSYKLGRFLTYIPRNFIVLYQKMKKKMIKYEQNGLYTGKPRDRKIIVSLTSYPGRINIVSHTIQSLLRQTCKPDRVILFLSKIQFPNQKLPRALTKARKYGLDIVFTEDDLKPHKKYFYAMKQYPEDIIITVDDDVYYTTKLIERLYRSYNQHPKCVSASRVHKITFSISGELLPYNSWQKDYSDRMGRESMRLVATGVGGVLYPPHCLHMSAFDPERIKATCLMADDLWLKVMEVLNGTKVVLASKDRELKIIS